ncbi:MAG: DUF5916 domain-containing protein [Gemmatimonadota bacterium]
MRLPVAGATPLIRTMTRRAATLALPVALAACLAGASGATAQAYTPPSLRAVRMAPGQTIKLDGRLDDAAWQRAPVAGGFRQREPHVGQPATMATEVRVVYDASTLYIGVRAVEPPEDVIARILHRDQLMRGDFGGLGFAGDDGVALLLDTFHDRRNAFVFATNPNGAVYDALLTDEGREINADWRGVWQARAHRTADGWSAEFAIPFRTLRFPEGASEETWGFNVYRVVRATNEETLWSSYLRLNEGFAKVSRAGTLTGLHDLPSSGMNMEVKPYALAGRTRQDTLLGMPGSPAFRNRTRTEMGIDGKWEVHPGLTLDATYNTDFAQVEADEQQVNLTRFSLFYPEKRDFFLENAGIFQFGQRGFHGPPPFLLFFSRRIGISASQQPVPVLGGTRLSGRAGHQTIGLLDVATDARYGQPRTNFAVARIKRDVGRSGYIGAMITDRRGGGDWNTAGGLDASLWAYNINFQAFYARTATADGTGNDGAWRIAADYTGDHYGFNIGHMGIGRHVVVESGFVTRTDILSNNWEGRITARPDFLGLRKVDFFLNGNAVTDLGGRLLDFNTGPTISPAWNTGESLRLSYEPGSTQIDRDFMLSDSVPVPAGRYRADQISLSGSTSSARSVVASASVNFQRIYDGHINSYSASLSLTPDPHITTSAGYTHNDVRLPGGSFSADIAQLRIDAAANTRLFAAALIQYNQLDHTISSNIRIDFIHRPGSDLFIVFNEHRGSAADLWALGDQGAVVKLTYLVRL